MHLSRFLKGILLSVIYAIVLSFVPIYHFFEYYTGIYIPIPWVYIRIIDAILLLIYPFAAFKLGANSISGSRGCLIGLSLGVSKFTIESVTHFHRHWHGEYVISYTYTSFVNPVLGMLNKINIVGQADMLLQTMAINYIVLGTFIGGLGGLYGYLNKLSHPLKRNRISNSVYVLRDYWSNRQSFGKNRFQENPKLDLSSDDKPPSAIFPELSLRSRDSYVDVIDRASDRSIATGLMDPNTLAMKFEPQWNPIPLATERKLHKMIMPISVVVSVFSILISFERLLTLIIVSIGTPPTQLDFWLLTSYLADVIGNISMAVFPVLLTFGLMILLTTKVREIHKIKPESSLTLLFLSLFLPILIYGSSVFSFSMLSGDMGTANLWASVLLVSLFLLFISSLRIRDFENISVYLYYAAEETSPFLYPKDRPVWTRGDFYWVIRYMYYWPLELTIPLPHMDWERVEVWVNARTGQVEWVTSDYHYRELWYEVVEPIDRVIVDFDPNFHTPLPVTFKDEFEYIQQFLYARLSLIHHLISQLKYLVKGKWYNLWVGTVFESPMREAYRQLHPTDFIEEVTGSKLLASSLASLHWKNWRYQYGSDRRELYSAGGENYPATVLIPSERAILRRPSPTPSRGFCPSCGTPVEPGDMFCRKCGAKLS